MTSKEYRNYGPEDFALDESFQNWVLHPDVKNNYFWKSWLNDHPHKEDTIHKAIALVRSVKFSSYKLSSSEKELLKDSIWYKLDDEEEENDLNAGSAHSSFKWRRLWTYAAAVVVAVFMVIGITRIAESYSEKTISIHDYTGFGEVKTVILPDSSTVVLNANSKLVYSDKKGGEREVWIDGEAFFEVRHMTDNKKFLVHTYNNVSVEVLGTRFNVNTREKNITVVLQKGNIKLNIGEGGSAWQTQVYLSPGEMLSYNKQDGNYTKSDVDASLYDSWAGGKLMMDNFSLSDAAQFIQETFNKKLNISDKQLIDLKISGSMPIVYNIDTMMVQLEKAFQVHLYHDGNDIRVEK